MREWQNKKKKNGEVCVYSITPEGEALDVTIVKE